MDDLLKEMAPFDGKTPEERARRRRLVATAAICGLGFVGIGQLATGALFEDSATAAVSNASGNVSIQANGSAATPPTSLPATRPSARSRCTTADPST